MAYIRFASVYRDFSDIESFKQEIDALLDSGEQSNGVHPDQIQMLDDDAATPHQAQAPPKTEALPNVHKPIRRKNCQNSVILI